MVHDVSIRLCTPYDATLLSGLMCRTFYDTFVGTATEEDMQAALADWFNVPRLVSRLGDPHGRAYVAEAADGTPAGYLWLRQHVPPFPAPDAPEGGALELQNLYVEKAWYSTGLGAALMQTFYREAAARSCTYLFLGVWEYNFRAQRFYTKEGFAYTGHDHPFPIYNTPQTDQWWEKKVDFGIRISD